MVKRRAAVLILLVSLCISAPLVIIGTWGAWHLATLTLKWLVAERSPFLLLAGVASSCFSVALAAVGACGFLAPLFDYADGQLVTWKEVPARNCSIPVPNWLWSRVDALYRDGIGIERFYVQYLANDPFLLVRDGAEQYYIGVWDEKGFGK